MESVRLLLDQAQEKFEQEDYQGVLSDLAQAVSLDPDDSDIYFLRGKTREGMQDMKAQFGIIPRQLD